MKFPITHSATCGHRKHATSISIRPDLLRSLGFPPGAPLVAVVDRQMVILCRSEAAEMWEHVLEDFPSLFIRQRERQERR